MDGAVVASLGHLDPLLGVDAMAGYTGMTHECYRSKEGCTLNKGNECFHTSPSPAAAGP